MQRFLLLKKIGYVQSKTGIAEDSSISGTKKAPTEESKPSPLVVPSTSIWADSTLVPSTPPTSNTSYVGIVVLTNILYTRVREYTKNSGPTISQEQIAAEIVWSVENK